MEKYSDMRRSVKGCLFNCTDALRLNALAGLLDCLSSIPSPRRRFYPVAKNHFLLVLFTALSCPLKKIPNSDKADGITGKVDEKVSVKCNGATESFAVVCTAIGPETVSWTGFAPCPGVFSIGFLRTHG